MKNTLLFFVCLAPLIGFAQQERNHWFMGTYVGMKFTGGKMSVIPVNTTPSYAPYASTSYSNPATGDLMFYTNGSYVYNRQHKQMPNGFYINEETFSIHTVIVPDPANPGLFYIISSASSESKLYYATVDVRLQGGLGDVVSKAHLLDSSADLPFCIVKQLYDEGYWLITHTTHSNEFKSYRIGKDGLDPVPVISYAGTASTDDPRYTYGKMISNSKGDRFVFSHGLLNWTDVRAVCEEFLFDKACGTVKFNQSFYAYPIQAVESFSYPAYSGDDSKLYVSWIYDSGQSILLQYNLDETLPGSNPTILSKGQNYINGDMQLAPDGKIYAASSENSAVTSKISVIENPNMAGVACGFKDKAISLSANTTLYYTEHFPQFIMDISKQQTGYEKPVLVFENLCEGQPVSFDLKSPFQADSFHWNLGDGTFARTIKVVHQYNAVGDYIVSFNWYNCGKKYSVTDTLKLRTTPQVNLGNDTTLCHGNTLTLSAPFLADEYVWNTGEKTQIISVNRPGKYSVKVRSGNCVGQDEITVKYYDKIWTALGDEYFICDDDKELVKLDAGGDYTQYKWTPTGDTTQWIIVGNIADYFVIVKDFRGCNGSDGTKVKRRCPVAVFYPNVFTPNGDGINDVFLPIGNDVVDYKLVVYNAWGQQVFESNNILKGWDGMYQGKYAPTGTYVYRSEYSGYRNKKLVNFDAKGNLALLR
jgi:gliding motility-associated-like protein